MADWKTKGVQILYTLFMGHPIKKDWEQFYDFLTYYYYLRVKKKKQLPNEATLSWIYWEFLRGPEVSSILQTEFFDVKEKDYEKKLREFRKAALKEIVIFIDPTYPENYDYDIISLEDISYFFQQIAKTKIWNDATIRKNEALIRELANSVSRANFNAGEDIDKYYISQSWEYDDVDWMNPELPMTKAYEYLEKENWKQFVMDEFKPFVDALDLTAFKKLLKDPLKRHFLPRWWQAEFLLRHKRFNRIWASRRAWKTFLWAWYLAGRQLMLPMQTVVYVVPTLKNHARPAWKALSHYFGDCTEFKMNKSDFSIVNKETKSEMYFVTAERWDSVRWNAANLMIFDEASFIDEEVYETAVPLVRTTRGMVYGISTVNPKTPKNWFYYKLIDAEVNGYDPNSDSYARRIDLWHNPFIPDDEKQLIFKDGQRNLNAFNCEWMVNFADKDSFDLSKFWIIDEDPKELTVDWKFTELWRWEALSKEIYQTYPTFMLSYDWAKRKDQPWISVYWVRPTWWIDMVMSWYLEGLDYYGQVDVIYEIFKMLGWEKRVELLMDYWWAWVAVHEIFIREKEIYPLRFQTVWWLYEWKEDGIYKIGKDALTWLAKAQVALGTIRWFSFMRKLSIEFETYTEDVKRLWNSDNHWDILSSMMNAIYWANKQGYLEKKEPTKAQQAWDWEFAQYNNPELFSLSPDEASAALNQSDPYERFKRFGY